MLANPNTLESIEFVKYPNLRLHCSNGIKFEASLNDHNRQKFDAMINFPELLIEDYNANHGILISNGIEVVVYLEKRLY